ncbi:alcohol dehydrogenase catalytic domain-containing protein [Pelistega ratti]|uniref:alcohol dehydrogenase catalytic domain-containing protein n=1 Tax=Pelistega ratti TaxID=2652177 RepID=UPI001358242D|nr:zinc-binding dehydrogenase [Pelistega ratti]
MKAVVIYEAGGTDKLIYQEVPKPKFKKGWSLIKVKGFGINRSEIFTRKGYSPDVKFPRILGIECVGIVEQSEKFEIGTKIVSIMGEMGRAFDGSYAEYVLLPNEQIYPIESNLSWELLAAIPETYYTAYGSFINLRIIEEDKILVRGASSATGIAFCNLTKARFPKIKVYGSTQNISKREVLLKSGFDEIFEDKGYILQTEEKFNKILELIGPRSIKDSIKHLNRFGIVCSTGQLGEQWFLKDFDPIIELKNDIYLTTFYSGIVDSLRLNEMLDFINKYNVMANPNKIFKLDEIHKAHQYIESKNSFGKVVCIV